MVIRACSFSQTMVLMVIRARSFSQNYGERLSKPVALVKLWRMVIRACHFSQNMVLMVIRANSFSQITVDGYQIL